MKMKISSDIMYNEEVLNSIIRNFTDEVLLGTLKEKQMFLVTNGLASIVVEEEDNKQPIWDALNNSDA